MTIWTEYPTLLVTQVNVKNVFSASYLSWKYPLKNVLSEVLSKWESKLFSNDDSQIDNTSAFSYDTCKVYLLGTCVFLSNQLKKISDCFFQLLKNIYLKLIKQDMKQQELSNKNNYQLVIAYFKKLSF